MLHLFAKPDLSQRPDQFMAVLLGGFTVIAGTANMINLPFMTRTGGLLTYSKFANGMTSGIMVPSKLGMNLLYAPPAAVAAYMLATAEHDDSRSNLIAKMMIAHFGKRTAECCFVHRYSGDMPLGSSGFITFFYTVITISSIHYARLVPKSLYEEWTLPAGLGLFAAGLLGNGYHHWLLANMRKPGEKEYKVPRGGLFEYVACPHYLFELFGWLGAAVASQHSFALASFCCMSVYLSDRAVGQSEWNRKKLPNYPSSRKNILPFIF